jgi:hypothetical protein
MNMGSRYPDNNSSYYHPWILCAVLLLAVFALPGSGAGRGQPGLAGGSHFLSESAPMEIPSPEVNAPLNGQFTRTFVVSKDTYVNSQYLGSNYGSSSDLLVGRSGSSPLIFNQYTLLGFDLSSLPANAVIDSAVLQIYGVINQAAYSQSPKP